MTGRIFKDHTDNVCQIIPWNKLLFISSFLSEINMEISFTSSEQVTYTGV